MYLNIEGTHHPLMREMYFSETDVADFAVHDACPGCRSRAEPELLCRLGQPSWSVQVALVQCGGCELVYYRNPPTAAFMDGFYRKIWNQALGERAERKPVASKKSSPRMAALFADIGIGGDRRSVLDVGCGIGKLLAGLRDQGYDDLWGTELSPWRVAVSALRFPGRIFEGGYQAIPARHRFGAIFANHVVEHLPSPADALERLAHHLEPGGIIAITVPDSREEPILNQVLFLPHLHSFSRRSLVALGRTAGFSCLFWRGARWQENTAVFFRDVGDIAPVDGRFEDAEARPENGRQQQRFLDPWQQNAAGRYRYLTLRIEQTDRARRRRGWGEISGGELFAARLRSVVGRGLDSLPIDGLRFAILGKRGYLRLRQDSADGPIPCFGAPANRGVFHIK